MKPNPIRHMSGPVQVRPVAPSDARRWEEMREQLWPSPPGEHVREIRVWLESAPHDGEQVFVAVDSGGSLTGFAEVRIRTYAEGCLTDRVTYLEGIFVEPGLRGRTIGSALVAAVERWGADHGSTELASDTEITNHGSIGFHAACGFSEVERIVCFRKDLNSR